MADGPPCLLDAASDVPRLRLSGDWRLERLDRLDAALAGLPALPQGLRVDGAGLGTFDTAAALALALHLQRAGIDPEQVQLEQFSGSHARVFDVVRERVGEIGTAPVLRKRSWVAHVGHAAEQVFDLLVGHVNFLGQSVAALFAALLAPHRLRIKEITAQFEQVCLDAIPVVALVSALIGVVFAYLLGMQAEKYGANIFVVDGVAIGMTRELAPMLVAVIIAGRSGAAFTAQLGTMKLTEETDAIRTLGLSPMAVLVLPRIVALMIAMPLLTFVGDVASIGGAMVIADSMLNITPTTFIERLHVALAPRHAIIGLAKAPVFALFIAVIACRMGMSVSRDTRAIGVSTTSTVVQAIVAVIVLNALFAVVFQELRL
jgi:phospholipid/cholesterol/gamma-HCH transport system permease protein